MVKKAFRSASDSITRKKWGHTSLQSPLYSVVIFFYSNALANSDKKLRSPLIKLTWEKIFCPFILSII